MIDEKLLNKFKQTPGAISVTEAIALYKLIVERKSINGNFVDLGSNAGKSSMIAAAAFSDNGSTGEFYLVDPLYGNEMKWQQWAYAANKPLFMSLLLNRLTTFSSLQFTFSSLESLPFLLEFSGGIDYCFIDSGDHGPELLNRELNALLPLLNNGALLVFHDYGNQFVAVSGAYAGLLEKGFSKVDIDWEPIKRFVRNGNLEKGNDSWHCPNVECPNFIGALTKGDN